MGLSRSSEIEMYSFYAENGSLEWRQTELPKPGPEDVIIKVKAAGVNRPDLLQRAGFYPPPDGAPQSLGLEVSGIIQSVGSSVGRFQAGDRVMALLPGGGYSTHALADQGSVMPIPSALSFSEAAAFPETAFTVFTNVFEAGDLKKDERLFVHGATSGIGTMAVGMAKALGHQVFGTAGTDEKVSQAETFGFQKVWNYKNEDWSKEMAKAGGCDVVLDMVGGDYLPRNLAMLRHRGRHVSIAFLGGMEATLGIVEIMQKQLTITGSTLRARSKSEKSRLRSAVERSLFPLIEVGKLKPLVSLELPMQEADKAHQAMQSGELLGKAVLVNRE